MSRMCQVSSFRCRAVAHPTSNAQRPSWEFFLGRRALDVGCWALNQRQARNSSLCGVFSSLIPDICPLTPLSALLVASFIALFAATPDLQAASVRSHVVWDGDAARLQVTVDPGPAPEKPAATKVGIAVRPVNQRGEDPGGFVGGHVLELPGDGKPATGTFPLLGDGTPKDRLWKNDFRVGGKTIQIPGDHIRVNVQDAALGLSSEELLYPSRPGSPVYSHGVHLTGKFGERKAYFSVYFGPHGLGLEQQVELEFFLLDKDGNQLLSGEEGIVLVGDKPTIYEKEVTPARNTTGPYTLTFTLNNEALGLAAASEARFPFATLLVPVTSMESDTLADWHIPGQPLDSGAAGKVPNTLFSVFQPFARPGFDAEVRHSGARSLRIDYSPAAPLTVGSDVRLPGLPLAARIWVKGNNSGDRLVLEWRDQSNFTAPSYQRWMNSQSIEICRLDFADWRSFTIPVLGNGLPARDPRAFLRGHSGIEVQHPVQAPIHCAAIRVIPEPPAKDAEPDTAMRSVWIDDLMVEAQASGKERMTLELRADTPAAELHADAQLFVSVGNGTGHEIRNGRVIVTFQDADGETVPGADMAEGINVPEGEFATRALDLKKLAAGEARGPITATVTVSGPVAGQRVQGRLVFSKPTGTGLVWDFERAEHFNPPAPERYYAGTYHRGQPVVENGKFYISRRDNNRSGVSDAAAWRPLADAEAGTEPVAGGADGTARALPLAVTTNMPVSVLLHPALPGIVASIELQVFGSGTPVMMQPLFVDSGALKFDLAFQQFAAPPVRVDWKGWKACRFAAPPIPPGYAMGRGNPLYAPRYPLNLVLTAWTEDGRPAVVRVDQIKVSTHISKRDEHVAELDYPDETLLHIAGLPLKLMLGNFAAQPLTLDLKYRLTTPAGVVSAEGARKTTVAPGARAGIVLVDKLSPGFYQLRVDGLPDARVFTADVQVPDRKHYFGDAPMGRLADLGGLSKDLGLTTKQVNLDWDTAEPVPDLYHHDWFRRYAAAESSGNTYDVVPVVGYAADWAGPEKQDALVGGTYIREVGNYMQAPVRLADWNVFMRNVGREHARDFKEWIFWQSPDVQEVPTFLPPPKYRDMLEIFARWISLYNPDARVIAGGFSFDRVLGYLDGIPEPDKLLFDRFEVRLNPGSMSVEEVQMDDFLADLDARLKLKETGRKAAIVELDWVTDERLGFLEQAAYHARAAVLLHAAGALPHRFATINKHEVRDGFGVLFRPLYGNSSIQRQRAFYVPKPAYFALIETRKMLADLEFTQRVYIADRDPQANNAYLFKARDGGICAIIWRVRGARRYQLPAGWGAVKAMDAFNVSVTLDKMLPVGEMPLFLRFASLPVDQVANELRNLQPAEPDPQFALVLDLFPAEAASRQAAEYKATGGETMESHPVRLYAAERVSEPFLKDVREERFAFTLEQPGAVLMSRLWYLDAEGETNRTASITLNGGAARTWNLAPMVGLASTNNFDQVYRSGARRSAFVLRDCKAGRNEIELHHGTSTLSGGFRLTRVVDGRVDLTACGPLACLDAGVPVQAFRNAAGGPLALGKQTYDSGLGCMGQTALEYPLNRQFSKFTVTVGIDAIAKGRGSVAFRILVDGVEKAESGPMSGMTLPKTLTVENLDEAERLLLLVEDAGDGAEDDLANWVEPVLIVKEAE